MGLFNKLKEPVFLKETSSAKEQMYELKVFMVKIILFMS